MGEKYQKPASVAIAEFRTELTNVINNSGLPPIVLEPILANIYNKIAVAAENQYAKEKTEYEAKIRETEKKEE